MEEEEKAIKAYLAEIFKKEAA